MTPDECAALRKSFDSSQVGKLPKPYSKDSQRGNCPECGGYHGMPAAHLDFVGHAGVTARLLNVDPNWTWEPVAYDENGLPAYDRAGGLWIKLTVCGVTRLGYGDGPDPKQRIGDAIRNAAMRFGVALDLWSKQELEHVDPNGGGGDEVRPYPPAQPKASRPPADPPSTPVPEANPEGVAAPDGVDDGSSSPEAVVEALRGRVLDAMDLPKQEAIKVYARLQLDIKKAGLQAAMTTSPAGAQLTLGALVSQALDFVSKPRGGNAHADAAAGEQQEIAS